jgi:hypothetical protein
MGASASDSIASEAGPESRPVRPPVDLLWTGGWDSTFQLLQLLLLHRREVVPHYLLDPTRPSTRTELEAMERIRDALFEQYPHTRQLLAPLQKFNVADLAPDARITDAFGRIVAGRFIGSQYEWLARFRNQQGIAQLELAAGHRGGRIQGIIGPFVLQADGGGYRTYRLSPEYRDTKEYLIFGGFSFPLFELGKRETADIARERGWLDIMSMTWFCHKPHGAEPCGCCNPCLYAVDEGFGWRIPRSSRIKGAFYRTFVRPVKGPAKAALRHLGLRKVAAAGDSLANKGSA